MEQTLAEFKESQKRKTPKSESKIRNSWGSYDYYKFYRKNRPKSHEYVLDESTYFTIIRSINKLLVEELCRIGELEFPFKMGRLITRKTHPKTYIKDGKPVTSKKIDWDKTLELWYNDPESYEAKRLIYFDYKDACLLLYRKEDAVYKNKVYYGFAPGRDVKIKVREAFKGGRITPVNLFTKEDLNQIKGLYDE